jgi:TolB protein
LNGFTEIFLGTLDLANGQLRDVLQATNASGSSYAPAWSPDGQMVAFASDRTGDGDIYLMDDDGFNEQVITVDGASAEDRAPVFSPDGLWLAFISNGEDGRFQTYLMTVRGTEIRRLTNNPRSDISAIFKPLFR